MIFTETIGYNISDLGFDKSLTKALLGLQGETTPELVNVFSGGTTPKTLIAGELLVALEQQTGVIFSGKTSFSDTTAGYRMGIDSDNEFKFIMGTTGQQMDWNVTTANTLTIAGSLSVDSIDIGGSDATSFHVDVDGNMWLGAASFASGPFRVSNAGAVTATDITITSGDLTNSLLNAGSVDTTELANLAVTNAKIANATIESAKIVNLNADKINVGTLTAFIIKTAASGKRIEINSSGYANEIVSYEDNVDGSYWRLYGRSFSWLDSGGYIGDIIGFSTGPYVAFRIWDSTHTYTAQCDLFYTGWKIGVDLLPRTNGVENLGNASNVWNQLYTEMINCSGNITVSGTVDGVDIAAHAHSGAGQGGTVSHANLGSVTSDQHHARSHNHSNASDGTALTPVTVAASGTGSGTSSGINGYNICTTNGTLYYGSDLTLDIYAAETRSPKNFVASTAGSQNLGSAGQYWNDVSYKTLTDRGCLGWFDEGVELQDGRIVSDVEAIKSIQKHPTELTVYGVPRLDYKTMPKVVYKQAEIDGKILDRDKNDKPYFVDEKTNEAKSAEDGAEMTSLISIMLGAIKELDNKITQLESKIIT